MREGRRVMFEASRHFNKHNFEPSAFCCLSILYFSSVDRRAPERIIIFADGAPITRVFIYSAWRLQWLRFALFQRCIYNTPVDFSLKTRSSAFSVARGSLARSPGLSFGCAAAKLLRPIRSTYTLGYMPKEKNVRGGWGRGLGAGAWCRSVF